MESSPHQQYCLRWNNHSANLQLAFHDLLQKQAFTDVLLVVEDGAGTTSIKCHKMVLAACSTFFETIFRQAPSNEQYLMLLLPGVKGWEMEAILEYMYQGEVCVLQERINDLLKVAKLLKVKGLIDDDPQDSRDLESPPPLISSTDYKNSNGRDLQKLQGSPPHSTSVPYYSYATSPTLGAAAGYMPSPGWNHLSNLSLAAESVLNPLLARRSTTLLPAAYETSESEQNRESGILRTVLGQSHADSSQGMSTADDALELTAGLNGHSAFTADVSVKKGTKRRASQEHQQRKSSGKNYKLYSKEQMAEAIKKVENGECALAVATALGIPSRTLYDKVKKMGIRTQRTGKRHRSASSAHFPHGIGGNRNGDIYRSMTDHDDASMALLDMAQGQGRQPSEYSEISLENVKRSPSPATQEDALQPSENSDASSTPEDDGTKQDDDDVQDLSVQRTNVIVSPGNHHIKEEKDDSPQD
ncbi:protein bric-a-brac 2 [Diachasma alloeum]|uniref:protein bric-a-brac 2 n=1 Tax=Diachasma alloeum TaxID=454923 RepID=UPI0007382070|nr:protein bric-a-brac 2 [Diachasma alloeum]